MMPHIEIQVPPSIGPQLIIAGIERVAQCKLPTSISLGMNDYRLTFHQQTVRRKQLNVEQAAQISGLEIISANHIGLKPQGIAYKIAVIVGMQIYFFLYLRKARTLECLSNIIDSISKKGNGGE